MKKYLYIVLLISFSTSYSQVHIDTAYNYVGVKEYKNNRGFQIDLFNASVHNPLGSSWCGAFVGYCLTAGKVEQPKNRSGLARNYYTKGYKTFSVGSVVRNVSKPERGDILVWARGQTIYGHTGFVVGYNKKTRIITTIEGNTGGGSEYNGDGVYIKYRKIEPYNYFRIIGFSKVLVKK